MFSYSPLFALNRLFARYLPQLQRWAHSRVPHWARNAFDTGDIVQETRLHTFRNLHSFEPQREGALLGYLRRALLNRVRDQLSLVLYEALAGKHPLGEGPAQAVLDKLRRVSIPSIRTYRPECPPAVDAFFECALAALPNKRPSTAAELRNLLQSVRASLDRGAV